MAYAHEIAEQTARTYVEDDATFFSIGRPIQSVKQGTYKARNVSGYAAQRQSITCTVYGSMVPSVVKELYIQWAGYIEMDGAAIIARQLEGSTTWQVTIYRVFEVLAEARWVASRMLDGVLDLTTQRWV